ncbi:MAG: hypothetical protein ING29_11320 [Azospirillum sp.]|nr:hypothetical protein [Azospirillum sp.]
MIIRTKEWVGGWWHCYCSVDLPDGSRVGLHSVELPETAADAEIEAAIVALYETP